MGNRGHGQGMDNTKDLPQCYHFTNRNVTADNWFTSVPLVQNLLHNCGMILIRIVGGNKSEVPLKIKDKTIWSPDSSAFLFTKDMTLVLYVLITPFG